MAPLGVREVEPVEEATRFGGIVVHHRRLEVLTLRRRLAELAAKPAQEAHGGLLRHRDRGRRMAPLIVLEGHGSHRLEGH